MSTIASAFPATRNTFLRPTVIGGLILGTFHLIIQSWFVYSFLEKNPFISVLQYVASGAWVMPLSQAHPALPCSG